MKIFIVIVLLCSSIANAGVVNFSKIADGNEYGTLILDSSDNMDASDKALFTQYGLSVTASGGRNPYLDSGYGGLGVCAILDANNQCNPSSDDNMSLGDQLNFNFGRTVTIENIWINNNHDGNFSAGDMFGLNGKGYAVSGNLLNGKLSPADLINPNYSIMNILGINAFEVTSGSSFSMSFWSQAIGNPQFYVSAIEISVKPSKPASSTSVPEPSTLAIFALGIMGLVSRRLKKQ